MPSINNFLKGFTDGLPGMKDFRHASRLYIDDHFKLLPKQKFLFHVVISLNDDISFDKFSANERYELNMLVKACDLPRYNMNIEEKTINWDNCGKLDIKSNHKINKPEILFKKIEDKEISEQKEKLK